MENRLQQELDELMDFALAPELAESVSRQQIAYPLTRVELDNHQFI